MIYRDIKNRRYRRTYKENRGTILYPIDEESCAAAFTNLNAYFSINTHTIRCILAVRIDSSVIEHLIYNMFS